MKKLLKALALLTALAMMVIGFSVTALAADETDDDTDEATTAATEDTTAEDDDDADAEPAAEPEATAEVTTTAADNENPGTGVSSSAALVVAGVAMLAAAPAVFSKK